MESYTLEQLRRALDALPPGSHVMLPREALLAALSDGVAPAAPEEPDRLLTASEAAERIANAPAAGTYSGSGTVTIAIP